MQAVTHTASLQMCGCRQSWQHRPCSCSHKSQHKKQSSACLCPSLCPHTSTTCYFQQPSPANEMGAWQDAQCPASGELWGLSGVKGKGSPSLASPTPERGCDRLNPSLMSSGRWLLLHIATHVKIAHSDLSQSPQTQQEGVGRKAGSPQARLGTPFQVEHLRVLWPPRQQGCHSVPAHTLLPRMGTGPGGTASTGSAGPAPHSWGWCQGPRGAESSQTVLGFFSPFNGMEMSLKPQVAQLKKAMPSPGMAPAGPQRSSHSLPHLQAPAHLTEASNAHCSLFFTSFLQMT